MEKKCELEANGLKFVTLKSKPEPLGEIDYRRLYAKLHDKFSAPSYAVVWFDHKVLLGMWQDKSFRFFDKEFDNKKIELKHIQRMRVFNLQKELHLWRTNTRWKARLRTDDKGEETEAVEAHQLLFGTRGKRLSPDFAEIKEDRGTKLVLPLKNIRFENGDPSMRVYIKTHNYIKTNAVHQATYYDCRFVAFTDGQNDLL